MQSASKRPKRLKNNFWNTQYQLLNGLILAFKQCKVFSEQLHISFRNALRFLSKIPSFDFKNTSVWFLNYYISASEMPCYWFLNYLILVLKQRKIVFWTTWDNSPNYLHWVNKCLQFDFWNTWDNSQIYLHWHTKNLGLDFKTTCYSFLKHHIFILEALQTYLKNIADFFWKHRRIILETL